MSAGGGAPEGARRPGAPVVADRVRSVTGADRVELAMPGQVAALARDRHGRPVPWFVHVDDAGVPDFRVIRLDGIPDAVRFGLCWVCGRPRGRHAAFVIGPMCAVNRVSAEPPSHLACATYAARACPFLSTPGMVRRERALPENRVAAPGQATARNPGVALVWSSRTWSLFTVPHGAGQPGQLFDVGEPTALAWYARGRAATRAEVLASIESGLPLLRAEAEREGRGAPAQLAREVTAALALVPT